MEKTIETKQGIFLVSDRKGDFNSLYVIKNKDGYFLGNFDDLLSKDVKEIYLVEKKMSPNEFRESFIPIKE